MTGSSRLERLDRDLHAEPASARAGVVLSEGTVAQMVRPHHPPLHGDPAARASNQHDRVFEHEERITDHGTCR